MCIVEHVKVINADVNIIYHEQLMVNWWNTTVDSKACICWRRRNEVNVADWRNWAIHTQNGQNFNNSNNVNIDFNENVDVMTNDSIVPKTDKTIRQFYMVANLDNDCDLLNAHAVYLVQ